MGQALAPVLVAAKSPEGANELIVKAAAPVFVSVTVIGVLVVASGWLPKTGRAGCRARAEVSAVAVSVIINGLSPASSASDSGPVRAPKADGVKVTLMVQCAPAASVAGLLGQALAQVLVAAKSPEAANELIVKAAVPVFVSVTVIGVLVVASGWLPKPRLVGANPTPGAVPFPLSVMICGLPPALSASDSVPVRAPEAVGVKVTLMVQFAPAAKVAGLVGQALAPVLVAAKSPEAANELIVKAAAPEFVSVTVIGALAVASGWLPKPRLVGANPTPGAVPFPLSVMICGLPPALSVSDSVPVRAPEAVGVLLMLMVPPTPAALADAIVVQALAPVLVAAKSPEGANELIVKAAAPVFVSVTVIGALVVASSWLPKSRLVGANPTPGAVPFPLRENICGLPPASSASDSVPVRAPEAVGVKVTLMVQFAPAGKVAGLVGQALAPVLVEIGRA